MARRFTLSILSYRSNGGKDLGGSVEHYGSARPKGRGSHLIGTLAAVLVVALCYGSRKASAGKIEKINPGTATFDPAIQAIADQALARALGNHAGASGFAVVSDPLSGRVLAVANPDKTKEHHLSKYWALSLRSEPASVIKPLVVAAAIEKGFTALDEVHDCGKGSLTIDGNVFHDWTPFDKLSTADAAVHSSNLCTMRISEQLGAKPLFQALSDFGLGESGSAKDFPGARPGTLPASTRAGDAYYAATLGTGFTSGLQTTPLEIVQAYGAIANGGNLLELHPADADKPVVVRRVISEKTAQEMRGVLADVVARGTAKASQGKHYRLAGKTGTAWSFDNRSAKDPRKVGSFAGFAPADSPRVLVYVGLEDPSVKEMTGSKAAPVFREIAEAVLARWHVPVQKP